MARVAASESSDISIALQVNSYQGNFNDKGG